eukprot:scaffold1147_cov68-Phaeocystis_antarctica.AAC.7
MHCSGSSRYAVSPTPPLVTYTTLLCWYLTVPSGCSTRSPSRIASSSAGREMPRSACRCRKCWLAEGAALLPPPPPLPRANSKLPGRRRMG